MTARRVMNEGSALTVGDGMVQQLLNTGLDLKEKLLLRPSDPILETFQICWGRSHRNRRSCAAWTILKLRIGSTTTACMGRRGRLKPKL